MLRPYRSFLNSTKKPDNLSIEKKTGNKSMNSLPAFYTGDVGKREYYKTDFPGNISWKEDVWSHLRHSCKKYTIIRGISTERSLLLTDPSLNVSQKSNILAIATGRPKVEADYPLDYFGLRKFFKVIYTLDDCIKEEEQNI